MNKFSVEYQERVAELVNTALTLHYVVIIDLEATCTDDPVERETYCNEIIEIGWALLRVSDGTVADKRQFYVRPTTTTVNAFCTSLTGIEPQTVATAPCFRDVCQELASWHDGHALGPFPLWGSFGEYDNSQVARQCAREGLVNPLAAMGHINVKTAAQLQLRAKRGLGLLRALAAYGLTFEGRHHSGVDDAANIVRIFGETLKRTRESR